MQLYNIPTLYNIMLYNIVAIIGANIFESLSYATFS